jgi:hypothetical protein
VAFSTPALPQFARGTKLVQLAQQKHTVANSGDSENDLEIEHSDDGEHDHASTYNVLRAEDGSSHPLSDVFVLDTSEVPVCHVNEFIIFSIF